MCFIRKCKYANTYKLKMNNDSELKVICICNLQWEDVRLFLYLFSVPSQPLLLVYLQLKIVKSGIQQSSWRSRQFKIYYRSGLRRDETEMRLRRDRDEIETLKMLIMFRLSWHVDLQAKMFCDLVLVLNSPSKLSLMVGRQMGMMLCWKLMLTSSLIKAMSEPDSTLL